MPVGILASGGMERRTSSPAAERSRAARALQDHSIAVSVVSLADDLCERLPETQRRQYRYHAAWLLRGSCRYLSHGVGEDEGNRSDGQAASPD